MEELTKYLGFMNIPASCWKIDLSIARGLDYYTGTVFETVLKKYPEFIIHKSGKRGSINTSYKLTIEGYNKGVKLIEKILSGERY